MPAADSPLPSLSLDGRVAIVTGGGSGIGQAIAIAFAHAGALVAILDLAADDTVQQIQRAGLKAVHLACDVSSQSAVDETFAAVRDSYRPLHVLVTTPGSHHA